MERVKQIIFCSNLGEENCAVINNYGKIKFINRQEGIKIAASYMNRMGISSFRILEENQNIVYMKKEEFLKLKKSKSVSLEDLEKAISFKHKRIKKAIFSCYLIGFILSGVTLNKNVSSNYVVESNYEMSNQEKFNDIYQLLQSKNINPIKRELFSHIWDYLREYNFNIEEEYITKKEKPLHEFDEVKAEYLMYNDLTEDEFKMIFLKDELDVSKLKDEYRNSISKESRFASIMTTSSFKEILIRNKKGYRFYKKYENLIIEWNKEEIQEKKKMRANDFYNTLRDDFFKNKKINSYMLSIEPLVRAIEKACINKKNIKKLDQYEKKHFYQILNKKKKEQIKKYYQYSTDFYPPFGEVSFSKYQELSKIQLQENKKKKKLIKKK